MFDNLEKGQQTHVIAMDFSKVVDKVDHHKLCHKLANIGVIPQITQWIRSFLKNPLQRVAVDSHLSSELPVMSGVP